MAHLILVRSVRKTIVRGLIVTLCLLLLTAAVVFKMCWRDVFGRSGPYAFVNLVRQGWFSFVFGRFILLTLIVLGMRGLWRWSRAIGTMVAVLLTIGLVVFIIMKSYSPVGSYGFIPGFHDDMDHYFRLADGKVDLVHNLPRLNADYGHYEKTADGWLLTYGGKDPSVCRLRFSVFGIYLTKIEDRQATNFLPRRIIPFLRPGWIPDWLQ